MASTQLLCRILVVVAVAASVAACSSNYFVRSTYQEPPPAPVAAAPSPDGTYTVAPGDTIYVVARRFGVTVRGLIDANQLQAPFQLQPGQLLRMPIGDGYVVVKGDSLTKVARKIGVEFATLARINGLKPPYVLHVGQRLTLPTGANVREAGGSGGDVIESPALSGSGGPQPGMPVESASQPAKIEATPLAAPPPRPVATTTLAPPPKSEPPAAAAPSAPLDSASGPPGERETPPTAMRDRAAPPALTPQPAAPPAPVAVAPPPSTPAEPAVAVVPPAPRPADAPDFIWPVHGPVLVPFGTIAKGQRNDGINIAVPKGTPVLAAGDGEVAYAGNELSGFGNMLLVKHTGTDYVTVYAHNEKLLVRRGDHVRRGQKIALSGDTGGVPQPQLLFELRKGVKPLDPQSLLPNELSPAVVPAAQQDPG
jgi:murein DD-endopeptidase MepM/ murein hydrolase activator NlpD